MSNVRNIKQIVNGMPTTDGDGVKLKRIIGSPPLNSLDPFLLFDAFESDQPQDYIGGFPSHPHRGFETVTYMLAGNMRHEDSAGHSGVIRAGGIQWMTAGRGIIHSEMPEQDQGLLSGFQLWINLPAAKKMVKPRYQEKANGDIPIEIREFDTSVKVISGTTCKQTSGVIVNNELKPIYWDIHQNPPSDFKDCIPMGHNAFVYVIKGEIKIGDSQQKVKAGQLAVLEQGDQFISRSEIQSRYLLVAGQPINEPIARGGPFVMNTREEIKQAFADYQSGQFT